ncbi:MULTISPECIES: peptide ABC transporter permease [Staphylococcus]|uniref:Peptide ABC transporter permease n=1 Tax=Staphylococcus agnetis TaxID=985762 RepID=A0A2T4ME50_9STAP|nr:MULTISPECIES: peptide ABC transporter permease [Staphylococcus]NHM74363.1 peptide ABC transporter permease [Staphylococcus sp. 11007852]NHM92420.1 peptide ABC transporter permease [Staphylococcus sp. 10602379]NJI02227.1 peptide ABC transporter permease [Staphylococcus agnetis]NJI12955.1 peptide ABC transporter permease [Staphylococcus agnetis]PTH13245.1 peptide ABC transporter permease [Staphylococcus agnetis]
MLEFRKSITNKIFIVLAVIFTFVYLLGYFLPIGIDKVEKLSYGQYFISAYTVATEFGFLLFSFIIAFFINKEYSAKQILFYKLIGENIYSFFYKKILVLFIESLVCIIIGITVISLIFNDFTHYFLLIGLFMLIMLQYLLIIGTISIMFSNLLISIAISIVFWITSIIMVAINKSYFGILAPFEASNKMYNHVVNTLNSNEVFITSTDIVNLIAFFIILLIINVLILTFCKRRWIRLGL